MGEAGGEGGGPNRMKSPLISVIVPVYNVEKYIARCVDSILAQTYVNLEILLVDDGSSDRSGELCDSYAAKDSRIKVVHKKNGGLSDARNRGMEIAEGEYFAFVDSDDYIAADYIEYLYGILGANRAQISICGCQKVYENKACSGTGLNSVKGTADIYDCKKGLSALLYQRGIIASAWGKLFERGLFAGICFPAGRQHEDVAVMYKLFDAARTIAAGSEKKYYYFQRADSLVNSGFNRQRMDYICFTQECIRYMAEKHPDLENAAVSRHFSACFDLLDCIGSDKKIYAAEYGRLAGEIRKYRKTVLSDPYARPRNRLAAAGSFVSVAMMQKLCRLVRRP